MGDTRVARGDRFLITHAQIAALGPRLEPGDVLLERREWYLSNVGLPGFWPHTALYNGDRALRARYFDDEGVRAWVREQGRADGDFEAFLRERYPAQYAKAARVIEAVSEGVSFTTLEHSAAADSLAVLRPRATKRAKAIAIARAFGYVGRPYDFNFDFHTDAAMVCSEVVFRGYEGAVTLPLANIMGRPATPPNDIVREFDATFGSPSPAIRPRPLPRRPRAQKRRAPRKRHRISLELETGEVAHRDEVVSECGRRSFGKLG